MTTTTTNSTWQLDRQSAEAYERYLVPIYFAPGAQALNDLAAPKPGERVLDVACGTGIVARTAAQRVGPEGKVAGIDVNEGMLSVAAAAASGIELHQGDVADLPLPDSAFDVVFCQQAFQFFPDSWAALREMRRVLAPGGRLAIAVMRPIEYTPGYVPFAAALERHAGPEAGAIMRTPFRDWQVGDLRDLVAGAGFRDVQVIIAVGEARFPSVAEWLRTEGASSPMAATVAALDDEARAALVREVEEALHDYVDDAGVVFPAQVYVATARA